MDWPHIQSKDTRRREVMSGNRSTFQRQHATLSCARCLSWGHHVRDCLSLVRCKRCFNYGHVAGACVEGRLEGKKVWQRKLNQGKAITSNATEARASTNAAEPGHSHSTTPGTPCAQLDLSPPSPVSPTQIAPTSILLHHVPASSAERGAEEAADGGDQVGSMANFAINPERNPTRLASSGWRRGEAAAHLCAPTWASSPPS